jgi:hypothetical protein
MTHFSLNKNGSFENEISDSDNHHSKRRSRHLLCHLNPRRSLQSSDDKQLNIVNDSKRRQMSLPDLVVWLALDSFVIYNGPSLS